MGDFTAVGPDMVVTDPSGPSAAARAATRYGVAGMGFAILGGILRGMATIQSGDANAATDRRNAQFMEIAAGDAISRGRLAATYALLKGSQLESKQKAAYAGAGVSVNSGSALDVLGDTSMMSHLDAQIIENNAAREAWGYSERGRGLRHQADVEEATAHEQAGAQILGGVVGAASYGSKMIEFG